MGRACHSRSVHHYYVRIECHYVKHCSVSAASVGPRSFKLSSARRIFLAFILNSCFSLDSRNYRAGGRGRRHFRHSFSWPDVSGRSPTTRCTLYSTTNRFRFESDVYTAVCHLYTGLRPSVAQFCATRFSILMSISISFVLSRKKSAPASRHFFRYWS